MGCTGSLYCRRIIFSCVHLFGFCSVLIASCRIVIVMPFFPTIPTVGPGWKGLPTRPIISGEFSCSNIIVV